MNELKIILRIILSIITFIVTIIFCIIGNSITISSHNIPSETRENVHTYNYFALVIGLILIISIWMPWSKMFKK